MGNRLKYRVWSTEQKKMYDWSDCIKKGPNFIYGMFIDHRMLGKGCWCIQQCTGRKDKNGKLIFEGDIVQVPNNWDKFGMMSGERREVYFYEGGFRLKPRRIGRGRGYWLEDVENFEVIGNIYENPELLEGSNDNN